MYRHQKHQKNSSLDKLYREIIQNAISTEHLIHTNVKLAYTPQIKIQNYQTFSIQQSTSQTLNQIIQYPHSCIGLVICQYQQNNKIINVFSTGTLIHCNVILTTAENIYNRKLKKQYTNIRFIPGLSRNKHSGIYGVVRVYYPNNYKLMQADYQKFNYAILELYDNLSSRYGYVGFQAQCNLKNRDIKILGYKNNLNQYELITRCMTTCHFIHYQYVDDNQILTGNPLIVVDENNIFYIVGMHTNSQQYSGIYITCEIKNMINQCTTITKLNLTAEKLGKNIKILNNYEITTVEQISLDYNQIEIQDCQYLKNTRLPHLRSINLGNNHLIPESCRHLAGANWICLNSIDLGSNQIGSQGCEYLKATNWSHLNSLYLSNNNIGSLGCKYLKEGPWINLSTIFLTNNNIGSQGCKYLKEANWIYLQTLFLSINQINNEGCKYLAEANWQYLMDLQLVDNNIDAYGCKLLTDANWIHLKTLNLQKNMISNQGCKYLRQTTWFNLNYFNLNNNQIDFEGHQYLKDAIWIKSLNLRDLYDLILLKQIN